jgi:predicted nucleotidyltransferase
VQGFAKPFSDLDLAILGKQPLPLATLAELADTVIESDLPYKVDIVDWAVTPAYFRKIIELAHIPLQCGTDPKAASRKPL